MIPPVYFIQLNLCIKLYNIRAEYEIQLSHRTNVWNL